MKSLVLVLGSSLTLLVASVSAASDVLPPTGFPSSAVARAPAPDPAAEPGMAASVAEVPTAAPTGEFAPPTPPSQALPSADSSLHSSGSEAVGDGPSQQDVTDPGFVDLEAPSAAGSDVPAASKSSSASSAAARIELGPEGVDESGIRGRVHTVARGHTLWDISEAYLGTPWVWPSVWHDNDEIPNPHIIRPGDRIWITANQMRRISEEEATQFTSVDLDALDFEEPPLFDEGSLVEIEVPQPADLSEGLDDGAFVSMDQLPVSVPLGGTPLAHTGESVRVNWREAMSFVTSQGLEGASSVVESPMPRTWLAQGDLIFIGLGEGEVDAGDEFTIFRDAEAVRDPWSRVLLGYQVDILGWARVTEVRGETAVLLIEQSTSEIQRGDRVMPRDPVPDEVAVKKAPPGIQGNIVYLPAHRTVMGSSDYVYLNRGAIHGLEVGSELEVFDGGSLTDDSVRQTTVKTPDWTVADLVVVTVEPDSAVALVTHAERELSVGDVIRAVTERIARK